MTLVYPGMFIDSSTRLWLGGSYSFLFDGRSQWGDDNEANVELDRQN